MRIAQIAPLFESVPPRRYGGTERVVHWLTEELVAMGHDVTLFATGDSTTSAALVPVRARAARFVPNFERNNAPYARLLELVRRRADEFDVLHSISIFIRFRCSAARPPRSSPPCTAGWTRTGWPTSTICSRRCRWFRFRTPNAGRCRG